MLRRINSLIRVAGWAPLAVILLHGATASLFDPHKSLDPVFHFLGGAAVAYFVYRGTEILAPLFGELTLFGRLALAFGGACTIALFWEFGEFLLDDIFGTRMQASLAETIVDLFLGVGGAALLLLSRFLLAKKTTESPPCQTESGRDAM